MRIPAIFEASLAAASAVGKSGLEIAALPLREGAKVLSGEVTQATLTRRSWCGDGRAWIEVRGLDGPDGPARAQAVLDALGGCSGVTSVSLNRPLSRVVVEIDDTASLTDLCSVVNNAEKGAAGKGAGAPTASLPGDGLLMLTRGAMVGVNAAGLAIAVAGRALRWPAAPAAVSAAASLANYQPWARRLLEDRIGTAATDTTLSLVSAAAHVVTLSSSTLAVDLVLHALKAAESRAAAQAWTRREPELARYADHREAHPSLRPVPAPAGPVERHGNRMAVVQLLGGGLVGAITRNVAMASAAVTVSAPKPMRTTTEAFAATLGLGLADQHDVLPLRPAALRRLDKVDALLIDPRVLCGEQLRVVTVRGASSRGLAAAWEKAHNLLGRPGLSPGWHPVAPVRSASKAAAIEALVAPAHHPLASAVLAEARAAGVEMASIDLDLLGELRLAFDDLHPAGPDVDEALAAALTDLQRAGRTVAVLSAHAGKALAGADVALGIWTAKTARSSAPPWDADLLLSDLAGAWQVLRALPAARAATERGITLATSASALGAVLMVPGVRLRPRRVPGPVTVGAAAGMFSGYLLARQIVRAPAPSPAQAHEWHAMSVQQVRDLLPPPDPAVADGMAGASPENGVWQFVKAVRAELSDPLTPIMAVGSAATAILGSPIDAVMVGLVLVGNAMLAAAQQQRAENRLNVLLAQQTPLARKVIAGPSGADTHSEVAAEQLRPGDVIEVRSNEVVPADARVIEAIDLEVDESSLTGESLSVDKHTTATPGVELAERSCMLYAGTTVVAGTAVALVTAVGAGTQVRRAAELAAGELPVVGLQHQLGKLMYRAFPVSAGGGALVGALGLLRGGGLRQALGDAIAIAVAAVPEGMPLMATLAQQASAWRLSTTGALVRVPRSVEALGRLEVVCFDKTGTLSENRLRVIEVHPAPGHQRADVLRYAAAAAPAPEGAVHAHATDQAIIEASAEASAEASVEVGGTSATPDAYLPFRSGRAFSAAVSGGQLMIKGAPEVVLAACKDGGAGLAATVEELAARGLRVIAVGQRTLTAQQLQSIRKDPDKIAEFCGKGLSLTGFLGLADTPRAGAPQLLADLADRGVVIRLITGDHPVTATAIAVELGVAVTGAQVITGSEWNALSRKDQERAVGERVIFARMSPENKVQVVQTLERTGQICAMVGDGANDAAAIRAATVGIGVVARGSDSAHTIADVVLTDGRIGALVDAIDEGRRLWRGVQAAVSGLLGGNAGEVIFSVIGTALTGASPLNTRQLLLMNTLTDALPATAVAVSTPAGPVQRAAGGGLDERGLWRAVAFRGAVTATAATTAWGLARLTGVTGRPQRAATVALIALVSTELGQTLVDSHAPLVVLTAAGSFVAFAAMISTPGVSQLLGCTPVGPIGWAQGAGCAAAATVAVAVGTLLSPGYRGAKNPTGPAATQTDSAAVSARAVTASPAPGSRT